MKTYLLGLCFVLNSFAANNTLLTTAEKTDWRETGRYSEVETLCRRFSKTFPKSVRCFEFGNTPEGRKMLALAVTKTGKLTPKISKNVPVVLFQGGIHAGEIDGKDAGFQFLRELLEKDEKHILDHVVLVFVPVFNVDGHERFSKNNRPNQNGPASMGFRTTSQNLNLNRDYMKAESPEMGAMLQLLQDWDPIVYLDLHVTDGAQFQHDVAVMVAPTLRGHEGLREVSIDLQNQVMKGLTTKGHLPLPFYPSFVKDDEPESGFEAGIGPPRFSQQYWALRHRIGILVETHSWKDYKTRVRATKNTLEIVAAEAAEKGKQWREIAHLCEQENLALGGKEVVLTYDAGPDRKNLDFKGYRFYREKSKVTGGEIIRYDTRTPENWQIPFFGELKPKLTVKAPRGGYLVPPAYAGKIEPKLKLHGVAYRRITKRLENVSVEEFRSRDIQFGEHSYEGRQTLKVGGEWREAKRSLEGGTLFIPVSQIQSELAIQLMEPLAPDSLLSWGFFNGAYEKKEYIEAYVLEPWAAERLGADPKLREEFENKLKDKAFAASAEKRLDFFYEKHPSYDEKFGVYPVLRLSESPL